VLWEIGGGTDLRTLRTRLSLDSGYLSRLVSALAGEGLVEIAPGADKRVREVSLTAAGRAERQILDQRSDELAEALLDPLSDAQRAKLVDAMATVERLLSAASVELRPTDPDHPDARRCVAAYVAELNRRSERGFDPAAGVSASRDELMPPLGSFLVGDCWRNSRR
jgi:DNA-binding MarR family transcriptional regulator